MFINAKDSELVTLKQILRITLIIQILACIAIFLNIPIVEPVLGLAFLLFVPGAIFLNIVKPGKIGLIEFCLLSIGVSIAFLMFLGALINQLYPLFGYSKPLSALSIIVSIIVFSALLFTISSIQKKAKVTIPFKLHFEKNTIIAIVTLVSFPVLSFIGAMLVNLYFDNSVLMLLIILISMFVLIVTISKKTPRQIYPIAVVAIAIALLFHEELTTSYIYGYDMHLEYYLFMMVKQNSIWTNLASLGPFATSDTLNYNAMLSITILPTIFSNLLNISGETVYKIIYPLIFSLVPLGLFKIYQKQLGDKAAFLSVFFFMALYTFYRELMSLGREMIAEFFLVLLLFLFLDKKIDKRPKALLFVIFTVALTVSHYSTSYVYVFLLSFAWIISIITRKKISINKFHVGFTYAVVLFWAIFAPDSSLFKNIVYFFQSRLSAFFNDFFSSASRQADVLNAVGLGGSAESIGHELGRYTFYLAELFVVVGFLLVIIFNRKFISKEYKFQREFILFSFAGMSLLIMSIALPFFASALNASRVYHLALFVLSPFFIVGALSFFRFPEIFKKWRNRANVKAFALFLTCIILIAYFMLNIGFVYQVTGDVPSSSALSMSRMENSSDPSVFFSKYVTAEEVNSARWLSAYGNSSCKIYCDYDARMHVLTSYGMIDRDTNRFDTLSNKTTQLSVNSYVYLRMLNIKYGIMTSSSGKDWNTSIIEPLLEHQSLIYSNGGSNIYLATG